MPLSQVQQDILAVLKKANHVLVLPSSPIDGDSIGSALSLYLVLKKLGKKVTVVAEEQIPSSYSFLPEISVISRELHFVRDFVVTVDCRQAPPKNVRHEIQGNKVNIFITPAEGSISKDSISFSGGSVPFDCMVTVDAADVSQFGKIYENAVELWNLIPVINIDHHTSNTSFGKMNWVDIMAASTTMLVASLIEELGPNLMDADIATLLLAGLITDTWSFQNPNTTPDAFAAAAKLIGQGARQQEIIRNIYKTKKLSTLRLWGRTLTKIQYDEPYRLVWSILTAKDFVEIGGSPDETEGVIDELMSNAPGAEIIFLLKEKEPTEVGGSIRTLTSAIDASKLAGLFGGGGHMQAAGFKVQGKSIQEVERDVVSVLRDFQKKRLRAPEEDVDVIASAPVIANEAKQSPPATPAPMPAMPQPTPMPPPMSPRPPTFVSSPPMPISPSHPTSPPSSPQPPTPPPALPFSPYHFPPPPGLVL